MTQSGGDRLDRIEAGLENLKQRLDSQIEVNAELRTSVETLKNTTESLRNSVADFRVSAEALLATTQIHQQNFEVIAQEMRQMRTDISQLQAFERTTSTTLDRMGLILDYLVRRGDEEE
jgi:chromosome segregation ATPase